MIKRLNTLLLVSAGPGLLLLAFLMDSVLRMLLPEGNQTLAAMTRYLFVRPLFQLLLMIAALGLIWSLIAGRGFSRSVSMTYLLLGLFVLYTTALFTVMVLPESFFPAAMLTGFDTFVFQAGGALAALGLVSLFFWKADEPVEAKPEEIQPEDNPLL